MAMDGVLVGTGYLVGVSLRIADPLMIDIWPQFVLNLAVALPLIVIVHLSLLGLAGAYRPAARISLGTIVLSNSVALMLFLAWTLSSGSRLLPISFILSGSLATMILMALTHVGRSLARDLFGHPSSST